MSTDIVGRRGSTSTVWTGLCYFDIRRDSDPAFYPVDHEPEFTGSETDHSSTYVYWSTLFQIVRSIAVSIKSMLTLGLN